MDSSDSCKKPIILPRPEGLKGNHFRQTKRHLIGAAYACVTTATIMYWTYNKRRKRQYKEFYETFDPEVAIERMDQAGLLQSSPSFGKMGKNL